MGFDVAYEAGFGRKPDQCLDDGECDEFRAGVCALCPSRSGLVKPPDRGHSRDTSGR